MADSSAKMSSKSSPPRVVTVLRSEPLTPRMLRLVLGGDGLGGFGAGPFSDHYVKLQIPPPGASYEAPFDLAELRATLPKELHPRVRTYSVRHWDDQRRELTIDFVHHGATGVAGPWAAAAEPGDQVQIVGPGGAYAPALDADWHLMVGDSCVIPAIAASLARIEPGKPVLAFISVDDEAEEQGLPTAADLRLTWIHRDPAEPVEPEPLLAAIAAEALPDGRGDLFVHGEAGMVRAIRKHLLVERELETAGVSISGYWKRSRDEEGWRADKPEWNRLAEQDLLAPRISPSARITVPARR